MLKSLIFASVLALAACAAETESAAPDDAGAEKASAAAGASLLENTVWAQAPESGGPPGAFKIFLSGGTLITDSCWETYRLSEWRRTGDGAVAWTEDTAEIEATIVSLTQNELVLELQLVGGAERKTYAPAAAPFVCPDMPR